MPEKNNESYQPAGEWDAAVATDWQEVIPPARPSASEVAIFDREMWNFPKRSKLLILGATVEFRDLAFVHRFDTTIVDYMNLNPAILGAHLRHPERSTRVVHRDWRKMEYDGEFDLVVGDLAVNMVPLEDQGDLLKRIHRCLKPDGKSIQRIWIRDEMRYGRGRTTLVDILEEHANNPERSGHDYFTSLALPLINYFHRDDHNHTQFQDILVALRKANATGDVEDECLLSFEAAWRRYTIPNVLPTQNVLEDSLRAAAGTFERNHGHEYFSQMCPIYLFKR